MTFFNGKSIWITGASSGIGKALAIELSKSQAKLILSSRNKDSLEATKKECINNGATEDQVELLTLDLQDSFSLAQKAKEAIRLFDTIDILINNAGISHRSSVQETSMDVQRQIMEINYFGAISLSKYLLDHMLEKGQGHQVIINSIAGKVSLPYRSAYTASKHALVGFYESMQRELKSSGVQVTIAYPGYITTNISVNALKGDGSTYGMMDKTQKKGLSAEYCAKKILSGIAEKKDQIVVSALKERTALFLQRFQPRLLAKIVSKSIKK